ncbi:MAG: lycopene cyclase domain-containing protein [Pseudomonadota bacterium]
MDYIKWLAIFVWLPLGLLWLTNFAILWRCKRTICFCIFWALVFSIPWDLWATLTVIWSFPADTNLGIWIFGLPLEEYLFISTVTAFIASLALVLRGRAGQWLAAEGAE